MCNITKCCTEVCPEDIHITDNAIIPLKERVADRYYDPFRWIFDRLRSLLTVSEAITLAALERKESRGAHTRDDYPLASAEFAKNNVVVRMGPDGEAQISQEPLPQMPDELRALLEEAKVGA